MATTEKHKIIPTILSRCQIFDFKRITVDDICKHLQNIAIKENIVAEEEALNIIAQKADGALRDALSIFDQMVSFSGNNITYKDVIDNLNVLDYEYYFRVVDYILAKDTNSILLLLNDVVEKGFDIQHFIQGLSTHLRNILLGRDARLVDMMEVSRQLKMRYFEQAQKCSQYFVLKSLDLANQCDLNFKNSSNKRLHLEICLMKMCFVESQQVAAQNQQVAAPTQHVAAQSQQIVSPVQQAAQQVQPQRTVQAQVQPQPQAQVQSRPQVQVQPQPQPQPQPLPQVQTQGQVRVTRLNRPGTISITADEPKKQEVVEEIWNDDFTQEQLDNAWDNFVTSYHNVSPVFVAGIKNSEPTMNGKSEIRFKIDNILVVKDVNNMQALHEFLKKALHNNQFILKEELLERPREVVLYTDKQKFEKMASDNPNLFDIKESLKLDINV